MPTPPGSPVAQSQANKFYNIFLVIDDEHLQEWLFFLVGLPGSTLLHSFSPLEQRMIMVKYRKRPDKNTRFVNFIIDIPLHPCKYSRCFPGYSQQKLIIYSFICYGNSHF